MISDDYLNANRGTLWGMVDHPIINHALIESSPRSELHFIKDNKYGRRLAVEISGHPQGEPIFLLHGNPGCRVGPKPDVDMLYAANVLLIALDRGGYGFTDPRPNGKLTDTVEDVKTVAEHLDIASFSVIGRSGGGPEALACAALLPAVRNVVTLVSPGPIQYMGDEWYKDMSEDNVEIFHALFEEPTDYPSAARKLAALTSGFTPYPSPANNIFFDRSLSTLYPNVANEAKRAIARAQMAGLRPGIRGWLDALISQKDWGFDPCTIQKPTAIWYATDDVFTPPAHGDWLTKNIPYADSCIEPNTTHFDAVRAIEWAIKWCSSVG